MCGIAGYLNLNQDPVEKKTLQDMTDAISHRGPDGAGIFIDKYLGLGHRRLAILDLSLQAQQPMTCTDQRYSISYNGEIYNFKKLREELKSLGHKFRSSGDTEVVLNSWKEWGIDCLKHFNGMFAFAVWDNLRKELYLARDRYGIKPLYYSVTNQCVSFASEAKAILAGQKKSKGINKQALFEYFTFQNLFTHQTMFNDIEVLPAGSYLKINLDENSFSPTQYWDFSFEEPSHHKKDAEYLEELTFLLEQAVNRQLVSDVPIGSYLSGGVDSGTVTAIAAKSLPYLNTFTIGFDLNSASGVELAYDEREKAEYLSYLFKTEHYEMVLKAGDMERCMKDLVWAVETPRVGQSYPNFYAAKLASKFNKVVLSGSGSDELFGGYPWRYYRAVVNDDFEHYIDKYYLFWQRLINNTDLQNVFKPIWPEVQGTWTRDIMHDVFPKGKQKINSPEDYINHSLYFEAKTFLHGLLTVEDKLSMAHGLETRIPFLDNDLVDFAMKIPVHSKLGNLGKVIKINENEPGPKTQKYFEKTKDGKLILRKAMSNYVKSDISQRVKQGFSAPDASWYKGESIDYVRSTLCDTNAKIYDYMDKTAVTKLINSHLSGKENKRLLIWSLLSIEEWLKLFT
ncbi:MAG: asparagine synthase (glutamine-hydrolyzing) [Lentisphaeraceae bacterium]|nr:asparagine synthase (glutamine-hydrolyzing) [Lentisphaeraceae bacterium]